MQFSVVPLLKAIERLKLLTSLITDLMNSKALPLPQALYHALPCPSSKECNKTGMVTHLKKGNKLLFLTSLLFQALCTMTEGRHQIDLRETILQDDNIESINSVEKRLNIIESTLHLTAHVTRTRMIKQGPRG